MGETSSPPGKSPKPKIERVDLPVGSIPPGGLKPSQEETIAATRYGQERDRLQAILDSNRAHMSEEAIKNAEKKIASLG